MTQAPLNDCFIHDQKRLSHDEAIDLLKTRIKPIAQKETIELSEAHKRILARDITAPRPVPGHTNAAVDGYGFRYCDYDPDKGSTLPVIGRASAGHPFSSPCMAGELINIFTGAMVPEEIDTIVMQEDVTLSGDEQLVTLPAGLKQGANIRRMGEDVQAGDELVAAATILAPQHLAAIASTGLDKVSVFKKIKVALFSTGDEILPAGTPYKDGAVYDANAPMLTAMLEKLGVSVTQMGILPDKQDAVQSALQTASETHDFILSSGGASGGDEDHARAVMRDLGHHHIWKLKIKPGRPLNFGQIGDTLYGALPGNPIASFVSFLLYIRPVLLRLGGAPWIKPKRFQLPTNFELSGKKTGRREFWRARLVEENGKLAAEKYANDGSGLISSLTFADCLIDVGEDVTHVKRGELVNVILF